MLITFSSAANPFVHTLTVPWWSPLCDRSACLCLHSTLVMFLLTGYCGFSPSVFKAFGFVGLGFLFIRIMLPAGLPQSWRQDGCVGASTSSLEPPAQCWCNGWGQQVDLRQILRTPSRTPLLDLGPVGSSVLIVGDGVEGWLRAWPLELDGLEFALICIDLNLLLPFTGHVTLASYLTSVSLSVFIFKWG